ncbi:hypothetical protein GGH94_003489 [Coemansia aciculifera]|uniref:Wbp11/ELF5/Saf1 N-terminal domain-containing protein n=1 Tax=Coemansia aciculifera TaxID=417176 RepID=A0A9W8M334_9FUNG|nr:hypothetical protein GGH94_003489 [Coemansia aciculifera]
MGRSDLLGANPNEAYRKKAQEREAKRNKEVRDKMREAAVLHKDTTKMERKIEQYRKIVRVRKMTAAEKEKLQTMEAELKDVLDRQKAAGIAPRKREASDQVIGYDPMAAAEVGGSHTRSANSPLPSDSEGSDDDGVDVATIGRTIPLNRDDDLDDIPSSLVEGRGIDTDSLPPMPPGTPPLRPQDLDLDKIWPPLPSGPSPQYLQNNPRLDQHSNSHGRGHSQRPPPRTPYRPHNHHSGGSSNERQGHRAHPYTRPPRPDMPQAIPQGVSLNQPPPVPPGFPQPPQLPAGLSRPPPRPAIAAFSATVLTAEPQVRNLKKELTTLVPAAIARKAKQKERQQVLAAIPMVPKMVVNAAPDVDAEPSASTSGASAAISSTGILGTMRPLSGVRFNTHTSEPQKQPQVAEPVKPKQEQKSKNSLDEEYQKFVQQMNDLL